MEWVKHQSTVGRVICARYAVHVITHLNIGWKITLVTGARWPLRQNFSGGLGIHSLGVLLSRVGAPDIYSFSASANLASNSLTWNIRHHLRHQNAPGSYIEN